jgi:hypothetical protein
MAHIHTVTVTIQRHELPEHTDADFAEWLDYVTGAGVSEMQPANPLLKCDLCDYTLPRSLEVR